MRKSLKFYKMICILKYGGLLQASYINDYNKLGWRIYSDSKVLVGYSSGALIQRQKTEYLAWKALAEYEPNNGK